MKVTEYHKTCTQICLPLEPEVFKPSTSLGNNNTQTCSLAPFLTQSCAQADELFCAVSLDSLCQPGHIRHTSVPIEGEDKAEFFLQLWTRVPWQWWIWKWRHLLMHKFEWDGPIASALNQGAGRGIASSVYFFIQHLGHYAAALALCACCLAVHRRADQGSTTLGSSCCLVRATEYMMPAIVRTMAP